MITLGISCYYHDAAAALVRDGRIVAAAEEERFSRLKHDRRFPRHAIAFCLAEAGIGIDTVDQVIFYEKPLRKLERALTVAARAPERSGPLLEASLANMAEGQLVFDTILREETGYAGPVLYSEHHLSHAASAFYPSGFGQAAVLVVDGVGEWATTSIFHGDGADLEPLAEIRYPDSLGLLYATVTSHLGFAVNDDEFKVMGLAAYGRPSLLDRMSRLVRRHGDGSFTLEPAYFDFQHSRTRMYTDALIDLLGPARVPNGPIEERHQDIAASLQELLTLCLIDLGHAAHRLSGGMENLCLAGGVALNCKANHRLLREGPFRRIHVQPAASDAGGALGAALYADRAAVAASGGETARRGTLLGPAYPEERTRALLDGLGVPYERYDDPLLFERVAELLHQDKVVGWHQGHMEFGPRALGCRSILANPTNPDMQDILNSRIKFREEFRPFAPAVLVERAADYFVMDFPSPHMLFTVPVRPEKKTVLPAITHVDGTARVQTVERAANPRFYDLIAAFGRLSGVPVLINTSFNVRGEPIVCTPEDAYRCFLASDIDVLVLGNHVVAKFPGR